MTWRGDYSLFMTGDMYERTIHYLWLCDVHNSNLFSHEDTIQGVDIIHYL